MGEKIDKFIEQCKDALTAEGVEVRLSNADLIEFAPGETCSGYFEDTDPEHPIFAVACGRPLEKWFPIFVHEYCHFEQWRDRREWWNTFKFEDGLEYLDHLIEHFNGERELSPEEVTFYSLRQAEVEIDCERMVLRKIAEQGLPIDPEDYAKKANSYITYYYVMPTLRGWCRGKRPYEVPEIFDAMPSQINLTDEEYGELGQSLLEVYREHCLHALS
jgi:hypothetical protein